MDILIGFLMLVLLGALLWAVICLFRKGKRKRSLVWFGLAAALFVGTAQLIQLSDDWKAQEASYENHAALKAAELKSEQAEREEAERKAQATLDKKAQEKGYENYQAQKLAEEKAAQEEQRKQDQRAEEARVEALKGFPDAATQKRAKAAGIERYEAYRLLENETVITRYCAHSVQTNITEKDKHSQMDAVSSQDEKNAIWDKYERLQQKLIDKLNNDTGLQGLEYIQVSTAGHWNTYCRAAEDNWSVINERQANAATRADVTEAEKALRAFFQYNLDRQATPFFSKQRYDTVHCEQANHNDMRFLGCRLQTFSRHSKWQMFLVGRIEAGRLAIYPINGDTSSKLNNTQARFHDQSFKDRIFIKANNEPHAYLAQYAGPLIDISIVISLFE